MAGLATAMEALKLCRVMVAEVGSWFFFLKMLGPDTLEFLRLFFMDSLSCTREFLKLTASLPKWESFFDEKIDEIEL